MKPGHRPQIKDVFLEAVRHPTEERVEFLEQVCRGDPDLRCEVEVLLSTLDNLDTLARSPSQDNFIAKTKPCGQLAIGQPFAHYIIAGQIGAGGMGNVYLAEDTILKRKVALKVMPNLAGAEALRHFEREALAASGLNHPNILTVYEVGEDQTCRYIAAEFIEGESLRERLMRAAMEPDEAVDIAIQIASALQTAHENGIIHRDIKPENVMIRKDGLVKILDFGLANVLCHIRANEVDTESVTKELLDSGHGIVMGTPGYMSPEHARCRKTDARTDIWSFGCVLYEMLAGEMVFGGETASDRIAATLIKEPALLSERLNDVPQRLEEIIQRSLKKERKDRYQNAGDLLADLKITREGLENFSAPLRRRRLTDPTHWAIAFAILLIGLSGLIYYFSISESSTQTEKVEAVRTIGILPFKTLGVEDTDEYLRLGLTDALITKLSNLKRIVVRPTNAVREYDGRDPLVAGRRLGVDAVVDGNVQRIGQQLRVTVQVLSVADGSLLWGGAFDGQLSDIFNVQDNISQQIARALEPGLSGSETNVLGKRYTANPDAHQSYVKGRLLWSHRTGEDLKEAIRYFGQAIEIDPNYALAYVGLADANSMLADYGVAPAKDAYEKARRAALKALELDEGLAEAHASLAYIKTAYDWDWTGAENEYRRAISLNSNYASAHQWYSEYLTAMGRFDEALAEIRLAREIDPLSPAINTGEVMILYLARRYDEAIEQGKKVVNISPEYPEIHEYLKRCYDQKGMFPEAIAARQTRRKLAGFKTAEIPAMSAAALAKSAEAYWTWRLEQERSEEGGEIIEGFDVAEIYAQLGETELAVEWLQKAYEDRNYAMMFLKVEPTLDSLRSDPEFALLLRRVGLVQ